MAVELGTGYVAIVPSTQGFMRSLATSIAAPSAAAGRQAGSIFTTGMKGAAIAGAAAVGLAVGAAITASVRKGIDYDAMIEQRVIAFDVMLGGEKPAKQMVKDIQKFAAETPFEFPGISDAATKALAYGFKQAEIMPLLTSVGNAAAGIGTGEEGMAIVMRALGQMKTLGKVNARDMLQLTEAGIPAWKILADAMGVSTEEVMKMSEQGIIPADEAIQHLTEGMDKRFPDMMKRQSKTFTGLMSTLRDNTNMALGQTMLPLFERIKTVLPTLIDLTARMSGGLSFGDMGRFKEVLAPIMPFINEIASAFRAFVAQIRPQVQGFMNEVVPTMRAVAEHIKAVWRTLGPVVTPLVSALVRTIGSALSGLLAIVRTIMAVIRGDWKAAWGILKDNAVQQVRSMATSLGKVKDAFLAAGKGLFQAFLDGVKSRLASVKATVQGIVQWIRDRLPGSDARYGPLSDLTASGRALAITFSGGMMRGKQTVLGAANTLANAAALSAVRAPSSSYAASGAVGVTGGPSISVTGIELSPDRIEHAISRAIRSPLPSL